MVRLLTPPRSGQYLPKKPRRLKARSWEFDPVACLFVFIISPYIGGAAALIER